MTQVKFCGLKSRSDIETAIAYGAEMIGFVFAPSKRQVKPDEARLLAENVPSHVKKVGVFVNETPAEINRIAALVPLDIVQCHGQETAADLAKINYPTIKAFQVKNGKVNGDIAMYPNSLILLDAPIAGHGETFDWQAVVKQYLPKERLMIAGGLDVTNVATAIEQFRPFAVDVSSGVETGGAKDPEKIIKFIQKAKEF
ncbi:phosphoribosylanthranilate isomerase [Listeria rocourtiae]|uniref:phosphoribosylanthranilate isomerase n=1 Tax=Listeria rocourtiae TaxID=647910 RepID=UPI003D2F9A02